LDQETSQRFLCFKEASGCQSNGEALKSLLDFAENPTHPEKELKLFQSFFPKPVLAEVRSSEAERSTRNNRRRANERVLEGLSRINGGDLSWALKEFFVNRQALFETVASSLAWIEEQREKTLKEVTNGKTLLDWVEESNSGSSINMSNIRVMRTKYFVNISSSLQST